MSSSSSFAATLAICVAKALLKSVNCLVVSGIHRRMGATRRRNSFTVGTMDSALGSSDSSHRMNSNRSMIRSWSALNSSTVIMRSVMKRSPSFRVVIDEDAEVTSSLCSLSATTAPSTHASRSLGAIAPFISTAMRCTEA